MNKRQFRAEIEFEVENETLGCIRIVKCVIEETEATRGIKQAQVYESKKSQYDERGTQ